MKKLAVVFAVVVSGFVNAQWHNSKLDSLIVIPNFDREYPHFEKADSIVELGLSDSITDVMINDLINSRYGTILGYRYQLIFTVVMSNGDISIMILNDRDLIDTYLSNLEASFQSGKLLDEVEEAFFIMNN